jgi:hypothetical protein
MNRGDLDRCAVMFLDHSRISKIGSAGAIALRGLNAAKVRTDVRPWPEVGRKRVSQQFVKDQNSWSSFTTPVFDVGVGCSTQVQRFDTVMLRLTPGVNMW